MRSLPRLPSRCMIYVSRAPGLWLGHALLWLTLQACLLIAHLLRLLPCRRYVASGKWAVPMNPDAWDGYAAEREQASRARQRLHALVLLLRRRPPMHEARERLAASHQAASLKGCAGRRALESPFLPQPHPSTVFPSPQLCSSTRACWACRAATPLCWRVTPTTPVGPLHERRPGGFPILCWLFLPLPPGAYSQLPG